MAKKLSFQEMVQRCDAVHNGKYTYDESTYVGTMKKMRCICPEHGEFWMTASNHIQGKRCPACSGVKRLDRGEFIRRAVEVHGDKYDYSMVVFTGLNHNVTIICPVHGPFQQKAASHVNARAGCLKCSGSMKSTTEEFIEKSIAAHGSKYDYSKVEYKGRAKKVCVICPIHGEFMTIPADHAKGKCGCPKCHNMYVTTEEFIEKARKVHGDKFDYSQVVYVAAQKHVTIICPKHGPFRQTPTNHLNKRGCSLCRYEKSARKLSRDEFIRRATEVHQGRYSYDKVEYVDARTHVTITCPDHGDFNQIPYSHIGQKAGCPSCVSSGPSKAQLAIHEHLSRFTEADLEVRQGRGYCRYDIYLPEHKIAIEYNGAVWHSTRYSKDPIKDSKKFVIAQSEGVKMISIYDDEWLSKESVVLAFLESAIGQGEAIHVSECEITEIGTSMAHDFIERNHIQGGVKSEVNLALTHADAIVAVMSFNNPTYGRWELTRYCSTANIEGGPEKLLKAFLEMPALKIDSVIAYSENRLCMDSLYENLGFKIDAELPPDYWYTTGDPKHGRKDKSDYELEHLETLFPGCDIHNKTEREICEENGLYQIYDCGKRKWVLDPRDLNPET
jgi:hypothetical protein